MAQAESSLARISRFGTLTTVSALGQIVGPVLGGVIIGHSDEPSLESTSSALLIAAWVFVGGLPAAALALRTRIQVSTVRTGPRRERVAPSPSAGDVGRADDQLLRQERR